MSPAQVRLNLFTTVLFVFFYPRNWRIREFWNFPLLINIVVLISARWRWLGAKSTRPQRCWLSRVRLRPKGRLPGQVREAPRRLPQRPSRTENVRWWQQQVPTRRQVQNPRRAQVQPWTDVQEKRRGVHPAEGHLRLCTRSIPVRSEEGAVPSAAAEVPSGEGEIRSSAEKLPPGLLT